jgi:hypothetical protein
MEDMVDFPEGWTTQLASDIDRDGMGLELLDPSGKVVAEIFRSDSTKTVIVTTFNNDIPLDVFERYYIRAWAQLDPFEDGSSFAASGISRGG